MSGDEHRRLKLAYKVNLCLSPKRKDNNIFRLNPEQLDYVNLTLSKSTYLKACPGSGKTEVVGVKSAFAIKRWTESHSGLAVLSFTRNAAKEIGERVNGYAGPEASKYPHFVGTFDSWIHNYIFQPFASKEMRFEGREGDKRVSIIDNEQKGAFLSQYSTQITPRKTVWVNEYFYLPNGDIEEAKEGKLNDCIAQHYEQLTKNKGRFFGHGLATYQDASNISYRLLKNNPSIADLIAKRFPCIIIDECQDLCYNQLMMLHCLWQSGAHIHLIGDINQSIYEFRKVSPEKLMGFISAITPIERELVVNYRSNQQIVNSCCSIMGESELVGNRNQKTENPLILWQYENDQYLSLPKTFRNVLSSIVDDELSHTRSAVLVRGRGLLGRLNCRSKSSKELMDEFIQALYLWHLEDKSTADIEFAMRIMGKCICRLAYKGKGQSQKQFCPESFASVHWRYFLSDILDSTSNIYATIFEGNSLRLSACTRLIKEFFAEIWERISDPLNDFEAVNRKIKAPNGRGDELASSSYSNDKSDMRMTTIHDVKGETLDAVLLISSPNRQGSKGGHYKDWLEPPEGKEECQRLAYVAFSRPKHLLMVATPRLTEEYLEKFQQLGFVPEDIPTFD